MEQEPPKRSKLFRNILTVMAIGIGTGLIVGFTGAMLGIEIPLPGAIVGAVMGISFVLLSNRKES